jgi:hypothetical protein
MGTFLKYVTAHNAAAWRDEIFAALRRPSGVSSKDPQNPWSLGRDEELEKIRLWIRDAVNPASDLSQLYRKLDPGLDLEGDILKSLQAFARTPGFGPLEAHYSLRMLWRVLLRRYAIQEARVVGRELANGEGRPWRYLRHLSYYYPRLFVGVMLGFFTLGASSGVADAISALRLRPWWPVVPLVSILLVSLLAAAEVERRIGHAPGRKIVARALRIAVFGALYAASLAGVIYLGAADLGFTVCHYGPVPVMWASVALILGFVFQLFWQDRSIGEPL